MGDPAGIGPEILVRTLALRTLRAQARVAAVGDPETIDRAARLARVKRGFRPVDADRFDLTSDAQDGIPLPASTPCAWGTLDRGRASEVTGQAAARGRVAASTVA